MGFKLAFLIAILTALTFASPVAEVGRTPEVLPRLVIYFQTTHDSAGKPISILPLISEKGIALTHLIVSSLHVTENRDIHLNDYPPSDPLFYTLWNETRVLKAAGVKVMAMVGGAARGSFDPLTLDGDEATFSRYYKQLHQVVSQFQLDGLDIDVEESMSQRGIERLLDKLHCDFGPGFIITLAPVASSLRNGQNLSGFDYKLLDSRKACIISFYNTQFYSGFGSLSSTADYDDIVSNGFKASKVVAGQLTSSTVDVEPLHKLNQTIVSLKNRYGHIGGIVGWEYFNGEANGMEEPWKWAQVMTRLLRPDHIPRLKISRATARQLVRAYGQSKFLNLTAMPQDEEGLDLDYRGMINA